MRTPDLPIEEVFKNVRAEVMQVTAQAAGAMGGIFNYGEICVFSLKRRDNSRESTA